MIWVWVCGGVCNASHSTHQPHDQPISWGRAGECPSWQKEAENLDRWATPRSVDRRRVGWPENTWCSPYQGGSHCLLLVASFPCRNHKTICPRSGCMGVAQELSLTQCQHANHLEEGVALKKMSKRRARHPSRASSKIREWHLPLARSICIPNYGTRSECNWPSREQHWGVTLDRPAQMGNPQKELPFPPALSCA